MSAPSGPGRPRASTRSRGSTRGIGRARDSRNGASTAPTGCRPQFGAAAGNEVQRHLKPPAKQNQPRNRSIRKTPRTPSTDAFNIQKIDGYKNEPWRNSVADYNATYKARMSDLYQTLKENRENERKEAPKNGFLADPDKPTSLANAITPVGTCQDMCPEFERVERIVQLMVDSNEKETAESGSKVPCEDLMVKRFRRSAAGYDEQLPSDIRPPAILKNTLDYLINDVVGGPETLSNVHKFVWDRTRGIRNDFSIQQVTKTEDLRIAIECFERIARFHILSLHQLSRTDLRDNEFDHHQEREQLNNTLLSLIYYYDDSRHKLVSSNEAEFRAYCIIFEIQDQRPDLEDRVQAWPRSILKDPRVRTALKIYAAAGNTSDEQGPLRPRTTFSLAQANATGIWALLKSNAVSYLTACVAEIYFNRVRASALEVIWKAYKAKRGGSSKMEDWVLKDVTLALGFDDDEEAAQFCEEHEFNIGEGDNGDLFLDLSSVAGGQIGDSNPRRKQPFSRSIVERKRLDRTFSAVVDGLTATQAQAQGFIEEASDAEYASDGNESLFIDGEVNAEQQKPRSELGGPLKDQESSQTENKMNISKFTSIFEKPTAEATESKAPIFNPFQRPSSRGAGTSAVPATETNKETNIFNPFRRTDSTESQSGPSAPNPFALKATPHFDFNAAAQLNQPKPTSPVATVQQSSASTIFGRPSNSIDAGSGFSKPAETKSPLPTFSWATPTSSSPAPGNTTTNEPEGKASSPASLSSQSNFVFQKPPSIQSRPEATFEPSSSTVSTPSALLSPFPRNQNESTKPSIGGSTETLPSTDLKPFNFTSPHLPTKITTATPAAIHKPSPPLFSFQSQSTDFKPTPPTLPKLFPSKSPGLSANQKPSPKVSQPIPSPLPSNPQNSLQSVERVDAPTSRPNTPLSAKRTLSEQRPKALDQLAQIMMTEDRGLLQQFVEYTIGPIIRSSLVSFEDEKSWARARQCRTVLLAKKYFARWKAISWALGLRRRAKERRTHLARSMREASQRPRSTYSDTLSLTNSSHGSNLNQSKDCFSSSSSILAPSSTRISRRQSISTELIEEGRALIASSPLTGAKRKQNESELSASERPSKSVLGHKRSKTLATSTMSAPPHTHSRRAVQKQPNSPRCGDSSLLGDTLKRQAQRFAAQVKLDTTRTDYFTLKALGVDPDTPVVPKTRKRTRLSREEDMSPPAKSKRISLGPSDLQISKSGADPDSGDDEALFASIRTVRETLAESTSWFQTERQSLERSMTPQSQVSPPRTETPAERRLRELRERGPTPTRAEMRQRAMADKSILPNGFWDRPKDDRNGHVRVDESEEHQSQVVTPPKMMGFAALNQQTMTNGLVNGNVRRRKSPFAQQGGSAEDAIEL